MDAKCLEHLGELKENYKINELDDFLALDLSDLKDVPSEADIKSQLQQVETYIKEKGDGQIDNNARKAVIDDILDDTYTTYNIIVINKNNNTRAVFGIKLKVNKNHIFIVLAAKTDPSKETKDALKKIFYIILCKAVQLDLNIDFRAAPECGKNEKHKCNPRRLLEYYRGKGFTLKGNWGILNMFRPIQNSMNFSTNPARLRQILKAMNNMNNNSTQSAKSSCFGRFCGTTRKRKNS